MCPAFTGFFLSLPHPLLFTVYQCDEFLSSRGHHGGSWVGYRVLPAIGAVSILELDANSGSRMPQAPNLYIETQLFV